MGITMKARKEAVIQQPYDLEGNKSKSTKYIYQLECKNYIVRREKPKQGLKCLLQLLPRQFDGALKSNPWNRSYFKTLEDEGAY